MTTRRSPLLGRNTSVDRDGATFHIQTEDFGIERPFVITHVFAEGGRIISTRKVGYADQLDSPNLDEHVRELIRSQHQSVLAEVGGQPPPVAPRTPTRPPELPARPVKPQTQTPSRPSLIGVDPAESSLDEIILEDVLREDD